MFLLTDGIHTDAWQAAVERLKSCGRSANIIAAVVRREDTDLEAFHAITPHVMALTNTGPIAFREFFQWISASIAAICASAARDSG